MSPLPTPSGFSEIAEWILHEIYEHPKVNHSTYTLFQQLERVLQGEPSQRDTVNQLREVSGLPPLDAEEHVSEKKLEFGDVQHAVETLIQAKWAKGERNSGVDGVFFNDLKLSRAGEAEAIRRKRKRVEGAEAIASLSERAKALSEIEND